MEKERERGAGGGGLVMMREKGVDLGEVGKLCWRMTRTRTDRLLILHVLRSWSGIHHNSLHLDAVSRSSGKNKAVAHLGNLNSHYLEKLEFARFFRMNPALSYTV